MGIIRPSSGARGGACACEARRGKSGSDQDRNLTHISFL
jgi:hypothetical protein